MLSKTLCGKLRTDKTNEEVIGLIHVLEERYSHSSFALSLAQYILQLIWMRKPSLDCQGVSI